MEYLSIFVKGIFIENMIFAYFLGMCSYLAVSKTVKTANGLGLAVIFVLGITVPINYLLETYVLKEGALAWLNPEYANVDLSFLSFIMFIAVIASMVQLVEDCREVRPCTVRCVGHLPAPDRGELFILGGALFMQDRQYPSIGEATVFGLGSGVELVVGHRHRRHPRKNSLLSRLLAAPRLGITFIITGLMGIAFMSFMGIEI